MVVNNRGLSLAHVTFHKYLNINSNYRNRVDGGFFSLRLLQWLRHCRESIATHLKELPHFHSGFVGQSLSGRVYLHRVWGIENWNGAEKFTHTESSLSVRWEQNYQPEVVIMSLMRECTPRSSCPQTMRAGVKQTNKQTKTPLGPKGNKASISCFWSFLDSMVHLPWKSRSAWNSWSWSSGLGWDPRSP